MSITTTDRGFASAGREAVRSDHALSAVADAVGRLRYGGIQVTIHDGKVVQIDVTERRRFT